MDWGGFCTDHWRARLSSQVRTRAGRLEPTRWSLLSPPRSIWGFPSPGFGFAIAVAVVAGIRASEAGIDLNIDAACLLPA